MSVVLLKSRVNPAQVERALRYQSNQKKIELLTIENKQLRSEILKNRNGEEFIRDLNQTKLGKFIDKEFKKLDEDKLILNYREEYADCLKIITKLDEKELSKKHKDVYQSCLIIEKREELKIYPGA